MKRYNIHIQDDWPNKIKIINERISNTAGYTWNNATTTADLIRYAIAKVFKFQQTGIHAGTRSIEENLQTALKTLKKEGKL